MSLIGTYRASGVAVSGANSSDRVINISGFKPSGIGGGNILGVALYCFSGNGCSGDGYWIPLQNDWLK